MTDEQTPETTQNANILNSTIKMQVDLVTMESEMEATGVLEETELEYGVQNASGFVPPAMMGLGFNVKSAIVTNIKTTAGETASSTALTPPAFVPEPAALPKADIISSHATTSQTLIDDTDHYQIDFEITGTRHNLRGDDLDIGGVSDDAQLRYALTNNDSFRAVLKSGWNSLKNIEIESSDLDQVILKNFVHTDVALTGDADKTIRILNAKRGFIESDQGDDNIFIKALSNDAGWSNRFEIDSGAGDDSITIRGSKGHTIVDITAGAGDDIVKMRGDYAHSQTDLGAGDDRFRGGKHSDDVRGGAGNDDIRGGKGDDILYGNNTTLATATASAARLDFDFVQSQAGYQNTIGFYIVAADGTIEDVRIIFENMKALSAGDRESFEVSPEVSLSDNVQTFIIANGYRQNDAYNDFDLDGGHLSFIYNHGQTDARAAQITDAADTVSLVYNDVYNNGARELLLKGHVFHNIVSLNVDGKDHTQTTQHEDQMEIAFEDLYNLGDRDYTDAVISRADTTLYNFTYETSHSDHDVIRGGAGNDLIIGGAGDDQIMGGRGTDIAVFMGYADQYNITKSGGTYIVQDTIENRDGTDVLRSIEGMLFGIEDLQAHLLNTQDTNDLDLSDLLQGHAPLQQAIDDFLHHTASSATPLESIAVQSNIPTLSILTPEDALLQSAPADIL
jgi:Ca2+-binding RTX toxin-like protein